jgi:NitT/TauT family transport system substrate-binding protein
MAVVRHTFCALLALATLAIPVTATAQTKLRVGLLPFSEALGAVIADKEGFFKAEGIEIEITKFQGGAAAVPVLQSGRIDIAFSNTVSTLQAIEAGLDAVVLAPAAVVRSAPPDTTTALMVRKGSLKSIKELEGKRVAVNVINSTAWLHAVADLELHGVDHTKVRFTEVPFPQMNDPLINNQVDAIAQVDPFRSALMATGKAEIVSWPYIESAPGTDITQYLALKSWVDKNHDIAVKFARAVIKGAQFAKSNDAATRDINIAYAGLNPALKDKVLLPEFATTVNVAGMTHTMELMQKYGMLKQPIDISNRVLKLP